MNDLTNEIKRQYGTSARSGLSSADAGARGVAEAFGYTAAELAAIPAEANLGLSCGNPTALANLRPGEVVVDLGSGAGLDVFLAADKVGSTGRAIGIDMTQAMIDRARASARAGRPTTGKPYSNVEFHLGSIDALPLPDASADVIVSNCVINLAHDKAAVFREMARVLKPGGRVAVSDIALTGAMPEEVASSTAAWCGCFAGAIAIDDYLDGLRQAGFTGVTVVPTGADLNAYGQVDSQSGCCTPAPVADGRAGVTHLTMNKAKAPEDKVGALEANDPQLATSRSAMLPIAGGCCGGNDASPQSGDSLHRDLAELLSRHDVNTFAAAVAVYAVRA